MKVKKVSFRIKSALSPLTADVLFGHFVWAYRYLYGEANLLSEFLRPLEQSPSSPPFLITNAFFDGYLPAPSVPLSAGLEHIDELVSDREVIAAFNESMPKLLKSASLDDRVKEVIKEYSGSKGGDNPKINFAQFDPKLKRFLIFRLVKNIRKRNQLPRADLESFSLTEPQKWIKLLLIKELNSITESKKKVTAIAMMPHNTIDRVTFTTLKEGGFYYLKETFFSDDISLYFLIYDEILGDRKINEVLNYIGNTGLGGKKNVGKGKVLELNISEEELPQDGDYFISLSDCAVDTEQMRYYKVSTKFGKVGEIYSMMGLPYKKPIILAKAGAVCNAGYKGRLLKNVHPHFSEVFQYALAFPYYIQN